MKFNKNWLWLIIPILIISLVCLNASSVSTVLLAIQGAITDGNLVKFSGTNGIGVDTGLSATDVADAVIKKHSQNTDTDLDETFEATFVKKADTVNVLSDITSTGADIEDAVTKKHSQNTDTDLGTLTADVNMGTHKLTNLSAPSANGDSIRATTKITEANLESAVDHKDLTDNPHTVTKTQVGLSDVENLKVKLDGTQAPTVDNDIGEGYAVGSRWVDVTNDKEYVCLDNTDGVAVWTETTQSGDGAGTYLELTDTPAAYEDGKYAKSTADGVVWDDPAGAGDMLKATYDTDTDGDVDVAAGGTEKSIWTLYAIPYLSGTTAFGEIAIGTAEYALTVNAGATGYDWTLFDLSLYYLKTEMDSFSELQAIIADKTLVNTTNKLSDFSATTSAELAGVISDETGSGLLVYGTSPNITTPTGIVKGDVGLGNVENTALSTWIGTENITTLGTINTGIWQGTAIDDAYIPNDITIDLATLATTATTANAGDAAVDFFGEGVSAVTDATECTDLEGTLLSIATGTLNAAIPEDHVTATMLKDDNAPADEDIYCYESTGLTGHWYSRAELGIGTATSIQDDLIVKADFADEDWGDMTVATNVVTIDSGAITYAKIQNISATDKILGRSSAGAGVIEEITCTAFARSILDDADEATFKATVNLEIGTDVLAYQAIGIADDNLVEIDDADAAVDDYCKLTANGIVGRSYAEVKTDLGLVVGTNIQVYDDGLTSLAGLTYVSPSFVKVTATDVYAIRTIAETKTDLSLNNVENTALSTWVGTENITTLGTIGTGVWNGTALVIGKLPTSTVADDDVTNIPNCNNIFDFCETTKNYALNSELHDAVTIGTANGLSLSTQVISMALADTNTTGALSDTDWDTFNNKVSAEVDPNVDEDSEIKAILVDEVTKTGDFTAGRIAKINNATGIIEQGTNTDTDVADAVTKKHTANADTDLEADFEATFMKKVDNVNALADITSAGADIEDAVTKKHSQNTDTDLDADFEATFVKKVDTVNVLSDITSAGANIEDAVTKRHSQNADTDLDATFEATFVKKADTVNVLSDITSAGANIEDAVTKKHTQNTDTQFDFYNALADDHTWSGQKDTQPVGESVVFGDLLYFDWATKRWKKADADAVATVPGLRIAIESKADGETCLMIVK